jgi:RNA polymerase sigma factor (sigma-70 family)
MSDATASTPAFELKQLLGSSEASAREAAWERLIARHTRLLLAVARSFGGGHDEAMDRYSYILEKCREADFRRLRSFDVHGGASFSTWLTVAARRLCLDHDRSRYGRHRATLESGKSNECQALRRALANVGAEIDTDLLPDTARISAEAEAIRVERDLRLQSALASLTARDRLLLALRFEDDLSASAIAGMLGVPTPFHVYRKINGLLTRLRAVLVSRGIDGRDG